MGKRRVAALAQAALALAALFAAADGETPLSERVGQRATLEGTVSKTPNQHLVGGVAGKREIYFDLLDGSQIVAYVPKGFDCQGACLLTGTLIELRGGGKGQKSEDEFTEVQLDVERWEAIDEGVDALLGPLADPALEEDSKRKSEEEIVARGKAVIPGLMRHLDDKRTCWKVRRLLNEGELTNRPANAPPIEEQWEEVEVTVGQRAEEMLLRILIPKDYHSPHEANFKPLTAGGRMFHVEDWKGWWERNKGLELSEIHEAMKAVVDAWFESRGQEQVVR